jgi:hypothetical protein
MIRCFKINNSFKLNQLIYNNNLHQEMVNNNKFNKITTILMIK